MHLILFVMSWLRFLEQETCKVNFSLFYIFIHSGLLFQGLPPSPNVTKAVFVVLLEGEPVGTAFAVRCPKNNKLLTAGHVVYDFKVEALIPGQLTISKSVRKGRTPNSSNVVASPVIVTVESYSRNKEIDWAILVLPRRKSFTDEECIPICEASEIIPGDNDREFKLCHCPAEGFEHIHVVQPCSHFWLKPRAITEEGFILFNAGFYEGSSGGVTIDRYGRAVSIHIESFSSVLSSEQAKLKSPSQGSNLDDTSIEEAIDSSANTHAHYSRGLIISFCRDLMEALHVGR